MQMIKIDALENGAHANQTYHGVLPEGWAVIPEGMEIPDTFPFVDVTVEDTEGVMYVVSMSAGELPVQEEAEGEAEDTPSAEARVAALEAEVAALKTKIASMEENAV